MASFVQYLKRKYHVILHECKIKGVYKTTMNYAYEAIYKRYFLKHAVIFSDFSNNLEHTNSLTRYNDAHKNQHSSFYMLIKGFKRIPFAVNEVQLLDIGCGAGRALVTGMKLGFAKVTGIDLDIPAAEQAKKNCHAMKLNGFNTDFQVHIEDATVFQIPQGTNLIYMFNPFGSKTLEKVITNIIAYSKNYSGDIYVIYSNPTFLNLFQQYENFEKVYAMYNKKSRQQELTIFKISGKTRQGSNQEHIQIQEQHSLQG